ncbi:MAG: primosomal protein N', partial [bacterium]
VALNFPIDTLFTYKLPDQFVESAEAGKRVLVNFGKKSVTGIIIEVTNHTILQNVKDVRSVLDEYRIISFELIEFCKWVSEYYLSPLGEVIFSTIPRNINIKSDIYYSLEENYIEKLDAIRNKEEILIEIIKHLEKGSGASYTKRQIERKFKYHDLSKFINTLHRAHIVKFDKFYSKPTREKIVKVISKNFNDDELTALIKRNKIRSLNQIRVFEILLQENNIELNTLSRTASITSSSIYSLYKKDLINIRELRKHRDSEGHYSELSKEIILNGEQVSALSTIDAAVIKNEFKTFLLYGVTGSGKTEIYINAIKNALSNGKTAIVLVPEISLTPQLIYRFKKYFHDKVGVIHSKVSDGEKLDTYDRIINGTFKIIIGARSALFAPLKDIGIIIVDEEHDSSYKQENSPRYNGRDAAIYRAKLNNAVVVLGSATPSIESYYNSDTGKYEKLTLLSRVSNLTLPEIKIIDLLKRDKLAPDDDKKDFFDSIDKVKVRFLSKELIYEIGERLAKDESIIILQNRRGYHSYLECLNCASVEMCVRCSISLTYHKGLDLLKCHYCGYSRKFMKVCTACGSSMIIPKGAGTERVEEELQKIFPLSVIQRMDSDTLTSKKHYEHILKDFYDNKINILTGTQMISKGLDFPNVTLVGVVNADIGLLNPDFRATEKTFQILTQVAGRSGRSENKGEVLIQTNHSDFYVFRDVKNHDYKNFYENEIKIRRQLNYPPFSRITIIETKSEDPNLAESKCKEIYNLLKQLNTSNKLEVLPPNVPLFSKLKNKFRFHLLIKSSKEKDPSGKYMNTILRKTKDYINTNIPKKISVIIDVDPVNLL